MEKEKGERKKKNRKKRAACSLGGRGRSTVGKVRKESFSARSGQCKKKMGGRVTKAKTKRTKRV